MSTAITALPVREFANAAHDRSRFGTFWKSVLALFRSHQRNERLDRLIAQYRTLPPEVREAAANREASEMIEAVRAQSGKRRPSWSEIAAVERALLTLLSGEDLKRCAWVLRAEFQKAISAVPCDQVLLKAYHDSKPPEGDAPDETRLRADLLVLQDQLHELCATRRIQIRARNMIACWTALLSAAAIFITLQLDKILKIENTIVFDVFGVGMLGGVFSTLVRVQKFKLGGNYEAAALSQPGNQITVVLAPAIGGVGAVVLFVMLAAGVLKGSLFPELAWVQFGSLSDCLEGLFQVHLASSAEAAKLYLLCFLAGFSERLVPDVMSRLAATAEKGK